MDSIVDVNWSDLDIEPVYGGGTDKLLDQGDTPAEGRWLMQSLDELVRTGQFAGVSATAFDAVMAVADRIEHEGIADDARKPLADLMRDLVHVALARQVQGR
ncbi:hypothetical protein HJA87_31125 [Rhizobium bangladeshense]|uniref:Uncharacterized protein n=1 Tax=Rhizobium bangladeshense TaxID=1138189 RepID=A0ABS7LS58_9HYPH|nr:hypothetical protein [Rhizobium bangladeshense]MBY3594255.1 hypothetical protein [Rhizobium bangladeshense]